MEIKEIRKSVEIEAPKEKVWEVLLQDKYIQEWYAVFSETAKVETDWQTGSKALFTDCTGNGTICTIAESKPGEALLLEFTGIIKNGLEDLESEEAQAIKGAREQYRLSQQNGTTTLSVLSDMAAVYFDHMAAKWEAALQKIKELAEKN